MKKSIPGGKQQVNRRDFLRNTGAGIIASHIAEPPIRAAIWPAARVVGSLKTWFSATIRESGEIV